MILKGVAKSGKPFASSYLINIFTCVSIHFTLCEAKFVQLASHLCEATPQRSSWGHVILKGVAKSGKPFASSYLINILTCVSIHFTLCEAKFAQLASHLCEASPQRSSWGHVILKGVAKSGKPFASSYLINIFTCVSIHFTLCEARFVQ